MYTSAHESLDENELTMTQRPGAIEMAWRRKWYLIVPVLLAWALAGAYMVYGTPIYEATTRLLLRRGAAYDATVPRNHDFTAAQVERMKGAVLLRGALGRLNPPPVEPTDLVGLLEVADSLDIRQLPRTDVVVVSYRSEDPGVAVQLVQALIDEYKWMLQQDQMAPSPADQMVQQQLIHDELARLKVELGRSLANFKSVAEHYGPKHPDYRGAEQQVVSWEKAVAEREAALATALVPTEPTAEEIAALPPRVDISTLSRPMLGDRPVWPSPLILFPLATVMGGMCGWLLLTMVARDDTLYDTSDVEHQLSAEVSGQIPTIVSVSGHPLRNYRFVGQSHGSQISRALRNLSRDLLERANHGGLLVQVTSPAEGSGTTTAVANLAAACAQLGKKVAVIDADLRHGMLHEVFDVSASIGLTSLSSGESLEDLIQASPALPVDVLAAGPRVRNPLHVLADPAVERAMQAMSLQYDVVFIDTPGLLTVSDASLLVPSVDVVLLVLQSGTGRLSEARKALEILRSIGTYSVRIVLNRVPLGHWITRVREEEVTVRQESLVIPEPSHNGS